MDYTKSIKQYAKRLGADVVGIADLRLLKGISTRPPDLLDAYSHGICVGKSFHDGIMDLIDNAPVPAYASIHKSLNDHLDMINRHMVRYIESKGYRARQIPATEAGDIAQTMKADFFRNIDLKTFDWTPLTSSSLPSKAVARAAGLGWFGKNFLIINPTLGPGFRHASVITDMPLMPDKPLNEQKCGKCEICKESCPVGAIRGLNFDGIPPAREVVLDFPKCRNLLWMKHKNMPEIGYPICGICITVCPWRKKSLKHRLGRTLFGWAPANLITSLPKAIWS